MQVSMEGHSLTGEDNKKQAAIALLCCFTLKSSIPIIINHSTEEGIESQDQQWFY